MTSIRVIDSDFEYSIFETFRKYKGKYVDELCDFFHIDFNCKNLLEALCARMLGTGGRINKDSNFTKRGISLKTIKVGKNESVKESMSFPTFEYTKIVKENWKESLLRNLFIKTRFLFVVFKENDKGVYFEKILFWSMPEAILDCDVLSVFELTKKVILSGEIVSSIFEDGKGKIKMKTNFPGMSSNEVCHVRPHARNSEDTYPLPVIDKMTGLTKYVKHCFWLNASFIKKVIS